SLATNQSHFFVGQQLAGIAKPRLKLLDLGQVKRHLAVKVSVGVEVVAHESARSQDRKGGANRLGRLAQSIYQSTLVNDRLPYQRGTHAVEGRLPAPARQIVQ